MRRQLTAYVGDDDFARLKEDADAVGLSLSRYIQERLVQSNGRAAVSLSESKLAATEKKIIDTNRTYIAQAIRPLSKQVTMLLAMLDQFALSMLTHLPEIPEAQRERALASGERRHHGWRLEVEDTIKQMESAGANGKKPVASSGESQSGDHPREDNSTAESRGGNE
ncbi:MAG TPA: hypothetical protein VKS44_01810 [Candidatus Acidoferrales bacterium]|nr:hypothetical protein [Candidatus Acidoferrales bacterium]